MKFMNYLRRNKRTTIISATTAVIIFVTISTCTGTGYITQAINGHFRLMRSRVPFEKALMDPTLDSVARQRLLLVQQIRKFATTNLGLPDNKSYTLYAQIKTEELGWNVYCAPRFSTEPKKWSFPIAGSTVYRGYFSKKMAIRYAQKMDRKGYDVYLTPITAYSTLGFFNDPILNTHLKMDTIHLAGMIIHELAHQRYYNKKDSRISESFAVAVERAGVIRWLASINRQDQIAKAHRMWARQDSINALYLSVRNTLTELYTTTPAPITPQDSANLLRQKNAILNQLAQEIKELNQTSIQTSHSSDRAPLPISRTVNPIPQKFRQLSNARLIPISTYYSLVPTFLKQLDSLGGDFEQFYEKVEKSE